jgi:glycerol-3-phosphate dehydrogenase
MFFVKWESRNLKAASIVPRRANMKDMKERWTPRWTNSVKSGPNLQTQHSSTLTHYEAVASLQAEWNSDESRGRGTIRTLPTYGTRHGFIALLEPAASSRRPKFTKASSPEHRWPCPRAEKLFQAHHFVMRVPALSGSSHQSAHFDILCTNATKQKDAILRRVRLALQPMKPAMPCFAETCSFEFQAFAATCFENSIVMYNHNMCMYIYII